MRICLLLLILLHVSCAQKDEKLNTNTKKQVNTENNTEDETTSESEVEPDGKTELGANREFLPTSFENCRMRAIDEKDPHYINVCKTSLGEMRFEDYLRFLDADLDTNSDTFSDVELFDERDFLPESEYPSRVAFIDPNNFHESIRRIAELGRVSDTEEMIRARENSNRIDRINENIREINAARERFIQERNAQMREQDAIIEEYEHRNRLGAKLRNPNPVVRVGAISLIAAQSSKKEFTGEFGQRHLALKNKFKSVRVEDIRSYKLVGSAGMSFLRSEEEFECGDKSFASDLLSLSESLLDAAIGIAPGSPLVKDSYELIFGTNMVTGEKLNDGDRANSLVAVGLGVQKLTGATVLAKNLLKNNRLEKLADHFWRVSAKFLKTSKDVFDKALEVGTIRCKETCSNQVLSLEQASVQLCTS